MRVQIAVCDDERSELSYLNGLVSRWASLSGQEAEISVFESAEAFLFAYEENKTYDILLLDIEMGEMDGVSLARKIRTANEAIQIIFITGYSEYISEGYEVAALHYLMKPVQQEKLFEVLNRAMQKLSKNERAVFLQLSDEMVRIPIYEIRYLEVQRNYVTIHGKQDYTVKKTLGEFEKELDERFFRTGRSYILNLNYIERVTRTQVFLNDGSTLPLPRGMYEALNRAIIEL